MFTLYTSVHPLKVMTLQIIDFSENWKFEEVRISTLPPRVKKSEKVVAYLLKSTDDKIDKSSLVFTSHLAL